MPTKTRNKKQSVHTAKNAISGTGELLLYGDIGDWFKGNDAETIVVEMESLPGERLPVRIHSAGGNIAEGLAIYNRLLMSSKPVDIYIDGVAASMASVIAMAGTVYMPENAMMLVHKPHLPPAGGNASELRTSADELDQLEIMMSSIYQKKTGLSANAIAELLEGPAGKGTVINGREAIDLGFADHLLEPIQAVASIDLAAFSVPKDKLNSLFVSQNAAPSAPQLKRKDPMPEAKIDGAEKITDDPKTELKAEAKSNDVASAAPALDAQALATQAVADERKRGADIRALGAKASLDTLAINDMIDTGLTLDQARAKAIDLVAARDTQSAPNQPNIRVIPGDTAPLRSAMAMAMLNRVDPVKFKAEGSAEEFRGMSIIEMARAYIGHTGGVTSGLTRTELAAKALHSTSDFPLIVADVANKTLQAAYQETPRTFQPFARQASAMDFKDKHSLNIGNGEGLELVNESGEFKRGSVSESDETYKVQTFGRVFSFTRQLMINDDLDALSRFISSVGALASRKESDVVYDLIKANAALSDGNAVFHAASHKNLGTGGAVSETTLSQARKLMRQQKGLDGEAINVTPTFLLVNSERETEAEKLLSSVLASATSDVNVFSGALQLIVESRLDGVTNNPWYVFASPSQVGGIEYAYLDGQTGPMIETRNGFDVDGVEIKVRHDFGAGWIDYRGAVKNPGV